MSVLKEVLSANDSYAAGFGDKAQLALPPARSFAMQVGEQAMMQSATIHWS